jgi:hypothetical protein
VSEPKDRDPTPSADAPPSDGTAMSAPSPEDPGLRLRLEEKLGILDELRLVGYAGHGTGSALHVEGRLIERKAEAGEPDGTGVWENIKSTIQRFRSDEIPGKPGSGPASAEANGTSGPTTRASSSSSCPWTSPSSPAGTTWTSRSSRA